MESGSIIARAPVGSYVVKTRLEKRVSLKRGGTVKVEAPQAVLAAVASDKGRVVVFGDTGCLDDWKRTGRACWELLEATERRQSWGMSTVYVHRRTQNSPRRTGIED